MKTSYNASEKNPKSFAYDTSQYVVLDTKIRRDSETGRFIVKEEAEKETAKRA